jgi:Family of unknown function (DUF6636)
VIAAVAVAAVLAAPTQAAPPGFRLPSGNIGCLYGPGAVLRCDILSGLRPEPRAACELDWTGLTLGATGRAHPTCAGDTAFDRSTPVLRYGRARRLGPFRCVSRRTGLRCSNRARHGFFLSRTRWRTF